MTRIRPLISASGAIVVNSLILTTLDELAKSDANI